MTGFLEFLRHFHRIRIAIGLAGALVCGRPVMGSEALLGRLSDAALDRHPRIAGMREDVRAAHFHAESSTGFFDPRAVGALGAANEERTIPGAERRGPSFSNTAAVQAGAEWALWPGLHVGVGIAERSFWDPPGDVDRLYQRTAGFRVRIPVLRDRGFRGWRSEYAAAQGAWVSAVGALRQEEQDLRRDVAIRLIDWLHAEALRHVAEAATDRVLRLQAEAKERVELDVLPAYQVLPANIEAALRKDELEEAEQSVLNTRRRLVELAGDAVPDSADPADLLAWCDEIEAPENLPPDAAFEQIGRVQSVWGELQQAAADLRNAENALRSDLSLELGYSWQGEGASGWSRTAGIFSDRTGAGEASLVWRRSLGARAERGEIEVSRARLEARRHALEALLLEQSALAEVSHRNWVSARNRLVRVRDAVRDGRGALDAEEERFQLGEGASRNVLEAQKDLTAVLRRQVDIAAVLLRERAHYRHAAGRDPGMIATVEIEPARDDVEETTP